MEQGSRALQGAAAQAALARAAATSMASVVLADPGQQPNSGLVLSLAPLMGAAAQVDSYHPKWLHVHVRPPVRGLLKLLKVHGIYAPALCFIMHQHTCTCHMLLCLIHGSMEAGCSVDERETRQSAS